MDTNMVLNASFNELVFENRHKDYGAYQIRKRYSKNVLLAGLIATSLLAATLGAYFINLPETLAISVPKTDSAMLVRRVIVIDDKQEEPVKVKPKFNPPPKGPANVITSTIIVTSDSVKPVNPNDTAGRSPKGVVGGTGLVKDTMGDPCINCGDTIPKTPKRVGFLKNGESPKDPGIDLFFKNNIKYPVAAKERGIEGTVWLSFVVDTKGEVSEVSIVKGVNPMLDKEVLRVAKLMPKWDPVSEDGELVEFIYRKPVRFVLQK